MIKQEENKLEEMESLNKKINYLKKDIEEKENKSKIDKKRKVIESLQYFLKIFFHDKYSFNKEEFCIKFKEKNLGEQRNSCFK